MDIQIKILTMDTLGCSYFIFISNIIFITSIIFPQIMVKYYTLLVLFILQSIELSAFIYIRAKEIINYLKIRIFCVNNTIPQIITTNI